MHEKLKATAGKSAVIIGIAAAALGTQVGAASANTNLNGSCEVYEFCGFRTQAGSSGVYDYDSADGSFTNNYFHGTSYNVNDAISYIRNRGASCNSLMWWDAYAPAGQTPYRTYVGTTANLTGGTWDNEGSSLTWEC